MIIEINRNEITEYVQNFDIVTNEETNNVEVKFILTPTLGGALRFPNEEDALEVVTLIKKQLLDVDIQILSVK